MGVVGWSLRGLGGVVRGGHRGVGARHRDCDGGLGPRKGGWVQKSANAHGPKILTELKLPTKRVFLAPASLSRNTLVVDRCSSSRYFEWNPC